MISLKRIITSTSKEKSPGREIVVFAVGAKRAVDGVIRCPAEGEVVPEVQCLIYFVLNISKALEGKE